MRRTISIPLISSPCKPPVNSSTGPRTLDRRMWTGRSIGVYVGRRATLRLTSAVSPRPILRPFIAMYSGITLAVSVCSALPSGSFDLVYHEIYNLGSNIFSGSFLDAFKARRGVHLQDQRSPFRLNHIHPGDREAHHFGRSQGG